MRLVKTAFICAMLPFCVGPLSAAEPDNIVKLEITPAAPPVPALKYRLAPRYIDLQPGNAAALYLSAAILTAENKAPDGFWEKVDQWLATPATDLPRKEVAEHIKIFHTALHQVKLGSLREECHWDFAIREEGFMALLPGLSHLRNLSKLLVLTARLQIAEGRFGEACETLTIAMTMARHVNESKVLICSLVSVAIQDTAIKQFVELVGAADSPNLYWTLTTVPRPCVDLRGALDTESDGLFLMWPQFKDLRKDGAAPEKWEAAYNEFVKTLPIFGAMVNEGPGPSEWGDKAKMVLMLVAQKANARAWFIAKGRKAEEVDKLPQGRMILEYTLATYQQTQDELFKWMYLPYPDARLGLAKAEKVVDADRKRGGISIAGLLLPALNRVSIAPVRLDRKIAALRCVESLRDYAAAHDGKLPEKLGDVKELPIPLDPLWNRPFDYTLKDGTAVLSAAAPDEKAEPRDSLRYEISVRAVKKEK